MKVSVILPVYQLTQDLFEYTGRMIESLYQTEGDDELEFIVIDNGSPFGGNTLQEHSTVYVRNFKNLGYCKAVNQGMKLATGDLIVVTNNDIKISPNWLNEAKEIFKDKEVGSVHFKMVDYDAPFNLGTDVWTEGKERWCHSSFYVIRPEAIPEGRYWEGYTAGGFDDYDFWHRVRDLNGWKQAYTNKAAFQHQDSSTYIVMDQIEGGREERDNNNREAYKERHGEYPDVQFAKLFPKQMEVSWKPFP